MAYTQLRTTLLQNAVTGSLVASRSDHLFDGSRTGTRVPGHKTLIKDGRDASSFYSMDAMKMVKGVPMAASCTRWYIQPDPLPKAHAGSFTIDGFFQTIAAHGFSHRAAVTQTDDNGAITRLHSRIRDYHSSFGGGVFLGELRETIRMIRRPADALFSNTKKFVDTLDSVRRDVKRKVLPRKADTEARVEFRRRDAVKNAMAGSWLELQFGLKPAVSDVRDLAVTLVEMGHERFEKNRFIGNMLPKLASGSIIDSPEGCAEGICVIRYNTRYTSTTTASVRYIAIYRRQTTFQGLPPARSLAQTFGLTLENFVPTVYELAPWSFLIDYFSNLGDLMNAYTTDASGLVSVLKTSKQQTVFDCKTVLTATGGGVGNYAGEISGVTRDLRQFVRTTLTRTPLGANLPLPTFQLTYPGEGSLKWANMAALLASARDFRFGR